MQSIVRWPERLIRMPSSPLLRTVRNYTDIAFIAPRFMWVWACVARGVQPPAKGD